jgi:hypothetical protein
MQCLFDRGVMPFTNKQILCPPFFSFTFLFYREETHHYSPPYKPFKVFPPSELYQQLKKNFGKAKMLGNA